MICAFNRTAKANNGTVVPNMPIDREHFVQDTSRNSGAEVSPITNGPPTSEKATLWRKWTYRELSRRLRLVTMVRHKNRFLLIQLRSSGTGITDRSIFAALHQIILQKNVERGRAICGPALQGKNMSPKYRA